MSFQYKQWWMFRSKQTLWGNFLKAKYCQRSNPVSKKWAIGDSQTWRHMMGNKHTIETHIHWKIRLGTCSFWRDNWLGVGPLAHYSTNSNRFNTATISDFMENGQWDIERVIQQDPPTHSLTTNGEFSCSSAWNEIREKGTKTKINTYTWHKTSLLNALSCFGGPLEANYLLMRK
ncbi:hypothetical protein H5410_031919 [Solanum commersonii]|uniref:Uncharacterized protein n=1 Tax=Solanum commersonii TaxID=4109 RepID=A0A9J5YKM6_SOLCO|nr:hypothetical protein H5410_031919 [Solanum commersonii]